MKLPSAPLMPSVARRELHPEALSRVTEDAVHELMRQGQSANTVASYAGAMRYWAAWYSASYGQALQLPVPIPVVVQFIVDHALREAPAAAQGVAGTADSDRAGASEPPPQQRAPNKRGSRGSKPAARAAATAPSELIFDLPEDIDAALVAHGYKGKRGPLALNTLVHRVAVLSKAHQLRDLDNPCNHPGVRELLKNVRRGYAERGTRPRKQSALTKEPLEALLATCDGSPLGLRDRALLLFAWASGGRRRSEVATATMENLSHHGDRGFVYFLGRSKANQEGKEDESSRKPITGKAAQALRKWLAVSGVTEGPIFRRMHKGGKVSQDALDPEAVRRLVQRRCALAGLAGNFSAHSLRSGFVTEAGRRKVPTGDAMLLSGHTRLETFMGYYRAGDVLENQAGQMLDDDSA